MFNRMISFGLALALFVSSPVSVFAGEDTSASSVETIIDNNTEAKGVDAEDNLAETENIADEEVESKDEEIEHASEAIDSNDLDDSADFVRLASERRDKNILIVGPGKNIQLQSDKVDSFVKNENPVVISINYVPGALKADYVFVTNANRYKEMSSALLEVKNKDTKIIGTSNVTCRTGEFEYTFTREPLLEKKEHIIDNSFLMLLKIFDKCGIKKLYCAGMDGYSDKEDNYFNPRNQNLICIYNK